jgi:uncharacterized protein (DUF736 family)
MTDFSARFSLFPTDQKKSENSPDATGNIELLTSEIPQFIDFLHNAERVEDYKGNQVVKIRMAGWTQESKQGKRYQSGKISPPMTDTPAQAKSEESLPF